MSKQVGRLAMRVEGDNWVAYYAMPDTMDGAIWLGSVKMGIVRDPDRKRAFMDLMKSAVGDFLGGVEVWTETRAPEAERSGRG